jgi:hypothetical protein
VAQSEADDKTKCDRHGNLYEQGWTFKNSTKGIILSRVSAGQAVLVGRFRA